MRPITVGIIGAAALVVGILIVREIRAIEDTARPKEIAAGELDATSMSLDRIRSLGY